MSTVGGPRRMRIVVGILLVAVGILVVTRVTDTFGTPEADVLSAPARIEPTAT